MGIEEAEKKNRSKIYICINNIIIQFECVRTMLKFILHKHTQSLCSVDVCAECVSVYIFYVYTRIRKNLCMRWSREDGRERVSENKCPYSKCTWHNQNFLGLVVVCFFSFLLFFKIGYLDWVSVLLSFFSVLFVAIFFFVCAHFYVYEKSL